MKQLKALPSLLVREVDREPGLQEVFVGITVLAITLSTYRKEKQHV